jgi:hypothetical protein
VSVKGAVSLWGLVVSGPDKEKSVNFPKLYAPLRRKCVTNLISSEFVWFAIVRVPGLDDVTEGEFNRITSHYSFLVFFSPFSRL